MAASAEPALEAEETSAFGEDFVGAFNKPCLSKNDGCFTRLHLPDESIEIIRALFPEGRSHHLQEAIGESLAESQLHEIVGSVMLQVLEGPLSDEDKALCLTEDRGPAYYMLCDDEDIVHDHGTPDGNMWIRRRCDSWRLVVIAHGAGCFVEFGGVESDGEWTSEGWWADESLPPSRIYRSRAADGDDAELCEIQAGAEEKARLLHGFAERFGTAMPADEWRT
jgi:hypothetical protein